MRRFALLSSILPFIICIQLILLPLAGFSWGQPRRLVAGKPTPPRTQRAEVTPQLLSGLAETVEVIQDADGNPHIFAQKSSDCFFMQGFLHARDRFFQMDVSRRSVDGTLAELLGPGENNRILDSDVTSRALGLARQSQTIFSKLKPEIQNILKSYAAGVNAYLSKNPLPEEYKQLKITQPRMWNELDSVTIAKGALFLFSFDTYDPQDTAVLKAYVDAGKANGFDGTALFFEDLARSAPFDPTFTLPDATGKPPVGTSAEAEKAIIDQEEQLRIQHRQWGEHIANTIKPGTLEAANNFFNKLKNNPFFGDLRHGRDIGKGSNWLMISGKNTDTGFPILVGEEHITFETPPTWYQIQLNVSGKGETPLNVTGVSIAGTPLVAFGHNDNIAWTATTTVFDMTDYYQEEFVILFGGFAIKHNGKNEPVTRTFESYRVNQIVPDKTDNIVDAPPGSTQPVVLNVPLRNNGPLIPAPDFKTAISIQHPGFSPSTEIDAFFTFNYAKSINDFKKGVQLIGQATLNFAVADTKGNIAYFTSGELPLREDLEAGKVNGVPPYFIRDGHGGNDWLPLKKRQPRQAVAYEILPFKEMPQVINPERGFIINCNNDPTGATAKNNPLSVKRPTGGFLYLSPVFASGLRAARVTQDVEAALSAGKITLDQARRAEGSTRMRDPIFLLPYIQQAFSNAQKPDAPEQLAALAADPGVKEAIARFATWDFSAPSGLRIGYDSFSTFNQADPTDAQIAASVSTTIYSLWRAFITRNTIDAAIAPYNLPIADRALGQISLAALGNLLDNFAVKKGVGASGISFFRAPELMGATPEAQRDFLILKSLRQALDALAGKDFDLAYHSSTNQLDYRWGIIHRAFFPHVFGNDSKFSIPSAEGNFRSPFPGLYGIPRDGGYEVPNACSNDLRAFTQNDFMFDLGPSHRFAVIMKPGAIETFDILPGGESEALDSRFHDNQLGSWLVSEVHPLLSDKKQLLDHGAERLVFQPKR